MYELLKPDFEFKDERGELTQLVHEGFKQVNVVKTVAGVTRGGHYHKASKEVFYVINGSVEVRFSSGDHEKTEVFRSGDFFLIPPMVIHSMYYPEQCTMVALYDIPVEHEDGTKDIYSE